MPTCLLKKEPRTDGFTLVELLIGVVIVGILSGLGSVTFQESWEKEQLKVASRAVVEWLEDTRMKAIQQSQTCVISINDASAQLEASTLENGNNCIDLADLDLRSTVQNLNQLKICSQSDINTNLSCVSSTAAVVTDIVFTPRGTVALGGLLKLHAGGSIANRCIAITQPLGLIRQGIESNGICNYNTAF